MMGDRGVEILEQGEAIQGQHRSPGAIVGMPRPDGVQEGDGGLWEDVVQAEAEEHLDVVEGEDARGDAAEGLAPTAKLDHALCPRDLGSTGVGHDEEGGLVGHGRAGGEGAVGLVLAMVGLVAMGPPPATATSPATAALAITTLPATPHFLISLRSRSSLCLLLAYAGSE